MHTYSSNFVSYNSQYHISGKKVVRGGATKGPLVSWILDVYTLVHNYLVIGYKNENNSGYAWKLPGVNTTSEPIPGNEGNIITNAR